MKLEDKLNQIRIQFSNTLLANHMYFTHYIYSMCDLKTSPSPDLVACISCTSDTTKPAITLNEKIVMEASANLIQFLLLHETMHLVQIPNFKKCINSLKSSGIEISHTILNIAMDAAIHEYLPKLMTTNKNHTKFFDDINTEISSIMKTEAAVITVEGLNNTYENLNLPSEHEFLCYYLKLLDCIEQNGNYKPVEGHDSHEFGDEISQDAADFIERRIEVAEAEARASAKKAGVAASDLSLIPDMSKKLDDKLKSLIDRIKVKCKRIMSAKSNNLYSYSKLNRRFKNLPGYRDDEDMVPSLVLVLDTSGSMADDTTITQLGLAAKHLYHKGLLHQLWSCDTELNQVDLNKGLNNIKLIGGGGTVFSDEHIELIKSNNESKKLDIVYITDEEVYGLDKAKSCKDVNLHIVPWNC